MTDVPGVVDFDDLKSFDVISLDIFDTTLKRSCGVPKNIFRRQGMHFAILRIFAEKLARFIARIEGKQEVSLQDIYRWLPLFDFTVELSHEFEASILNPAIFDLIKKARAQKKEIIFVSDMYLPLEFIKSLLRKNGVHQPYGLYVSSEKGLTKSLGLFELILEETGYTPERILHIGDNFQSDFLAPRKYGIISVHWRK